MSTSYEPDVEALHLLRYNTAGANLKEIIEGRDEDYVAIIRSLVTNKMVSNKLREAYTLGQAAALLDVSGKDHHVGLLHGRSWRREGMAF